MIIGIVVLFIGTNVSPIISGNHNENNKISTGEMNLVDDDQTRRTSNVSIEFASKHEMIIDFEMGDDLKQTQVEVEGHGMFTNLEILGSGSTDEIGKSELPCISRLFAVPTTQVSLEILEVTTSECSVGRIYPVQNPLTDHFNDEVAFTINKAFYNSTVTYPQNSVEITDTGKVRTIPFVKIEIYPVQYNPKTEKAFLHENIRIKISWDESDLVSIKQDFRQTLYYNYKNVFSNWVQFENMGFIEQQSGSRGNTAGCNYLIITHPDFESAIQPLADWHHREGLKTEVLSINTFDPQDIKDNITLRYGQGNLEYVLLVGDVDYMPVYYWSGLLSDYWYACITGSPDPDLYADVALGRLSVNDILQAENQVAKILAYEKNPPMDSWLNKILLVAHKDGAPGGYVGCKQYIRNNIIPQPPYIVDTAYGSQPSVTPDKVTAAINDGRNIVNYRGHGGPAGWDEAFYNDDGWYSPRDINNLFNGNRTPIVFNIACLNHKIDWSTRDCFGEALLNKYPGGAVASLGASAVTGVTANHEYDKEIFRQIYQDENYRIGLINNAAAAHIITNLNAAVNAKQYLWLGDPATEVWTDIPKTLNVTHPSILHIGQPLPFTVHVEENGGGDIDQASVCLWKDEDIYMSGYTDSSGDITFSVSPSTVGTLFVTVSKHNYIPYEGEAEVEPPVAINNRTGKEFSTIQQAIDDNETRDGDTLFVPGGIFYENVMINKNISLIGIDRDITIIDGTECADSVIHVQNTSFVTITGFTIRNGTYGIYVESSSNTTIMNTIISNNIKAGIYLKSSENVVISQNKIYNTLAGIDITNFSSNNTIKENEIFWNSEGIRISSECNDNHLYYNNFNNTQNAFDAGSDNMWDNSYPSGGNYWSDFDDSDEGAYDKYRGIAQNESGKDSIVDLGEPNGGLNPYNISGGESKDWYPLITPSFPSANANGPYYGVVNEPVQFNGSVYGGLQPYSWLWDFGEGNTSEEKNPTHNYSVLGIYIVTLTIIDREGNSDSDTTTVTIVTDSEVVADAHGPYNGMAGQYIQFTGSVTGGFPPYSWHWDFGDGNTSNQQNTAYTYSMPGTYIINFTVIDCLGSSDSNTTTAIIRAVYNIDKNMYYTDIQAAVDDAYPGDTIYVSNGTYHENIVIDKSITLLGENRNNTIIDGGGSRQVIKITADQVNISGFTIQISESSDVYDFGILIRSDYNIISDTIITNIITEHPNTFGIALDSSNNIVSGNEIRDYSSGIYLQGSSHNTIAENNITDNGYGIWLYDASNNTIFGNTILNNSRSINLIKSDNNIISENNITNNSDYGVYLSWTSNSNSIYHNNFISNNQHAYNDCYQGSGINFWDNGYHSGGNYWDDYNGIDEDQDGIGDTPYDILGGNNQDLYPLMAPYPSVDLIITDFSAEFLSETPAHISVEHDLHNTMMNLTATIKNVGNVDIGIPFQVSFYGSTAFNDIYSNGIIGTVEIPSLGAGETVEVAILWKLQPDIRRISAFADSTRVIEESNESNNWASITISYLLWNSLKETQDVYTRISREYETQSAEEIVVLAEEALLAGVFTNPQNYVQRMKTMVEFENEVGSELEGQMPGSLLLQKYQETVKILITVIDELMNNHINPDIPWEEAERVAEIQLQICEIIIQMLKYD